ncbi:MAG: hypothetical protein IH616_17095, partial [Gemmatimonadales bacterium]|nr:hypothetical protein [Gemmatimonadales bacterium]
MDTTLASSGTIPVRYALAYALLAWLATRAIRLVVEGAIRRDRHGIIDRTTARFTLQFVRVLVYTVALTAFFHVVPRVPALGSVLLAGVSVASVVFGLAASNTLSTPIAG